MPYDTLSKSRDHLKDPLIRGADLAEGADRGAQTAAFVGPLTILKTSALGRNLRMEKGLTARDATGAVTRPGTVLGGRALRLATTAVNTDMSETVARLK